MYIILYIRGPPFYNLTRKNIYRKEVSIMQFKTALLNSYLYGFPFSKEAGCKYIADNLQDVVCGNSKLDPDIVRVLGNKSDYESDKEYAVKMHKYLS